MAGSVRVNLSVPARVDAVLAEVAVMTGRSKAAVIMEAVGYQLATWQGRIGRSKQLAALVPEKGIQHEAYEQARAQAEWNLKVKRKKR